MKSFKKLLAFISASAIASTLMLESFPQISAEDTEQGSEYTDISPETDEDDGEGTVTTTQWEGEGGEQTETTTSLTETATETTTAETTEETTTTTEKDTTPPALWVNGINSNDWVADLNSWNITASDNAVIYYATAETKPEDWGSWQDDSAIRWNPYNKVVPDGNRFIHFWAVDHSDPERQIAETTTSYMYDNSKPDKFSIDITIVPPLPEVWGHMVISASDLYDQSGITGAYYYRGSNKNEKHWMSLEDNNTSASMVDGEYWNDEKITVVVIDRFGHEREVEYDKPVSNDPASPLISTDDGTFGIVSSRNGRPVSELKKYRQYGSEKAANLWRSVYANAETYLMITINEDYLQKIEVTVNDGKTPVVFTVDGNNGSKKWRSEPVAEDDSDEDKDKDKEKPKKQKTTAKYYMSLSELGLTENTENTISVRSYDSSNGSNTVSFGLDKESDTDYSIIYDTMQQYDNEDDCIIRFTPDEDGVYYGADYKENSVRISIDDDNGIADYSVMLNGQTVTTANCEAGVDAETTCETKVVVTDESGADVTDADGDPVTETKTQTITYKVPQNSCIYELSLDNEIINADGSYEIVVNASDLAENKNSASARFNIDTTAPFITDEEYKYAPTVLNYLSFGIFGNKTIDITVHVKDENGIGVDDEKVILYWAPETEDGLTPYIAEKEGEDGYTFKDLPLGGNAVPHISVSDKLGNTRHYCFTTESEKMQSCTVSDIEEGKTVKLELEDELPNVKIAAPSGYSENKFRVSGEKWYPEAVSYEIQADDARSGLSSVKVRQNGSEFNEDGIGGKKFTEMASPYNDVFSKKYALREAGSYKVTASSADNAGNLSDTVEDIFYVDLEDPVINEFVFGGLNGEETDYEQGTYGFYFLNDTEVRVYVEDPGYSSGISYVSLTLKDVNGELHESRVNTLDNDGRSYASFTIPKGFKGQVCAIAADNVAAEDAAAANYRHTSGLRYAEGSIIEDAEIHESVASVEISEDIKTTRSDANGIPLYNSSIPLTVTVKDSFSGIGTIEWSIANDNKSGVITVEQDGSWSSDSAAAVILETPETESNLVTSLQFAVTVESNTNGNEVYVKLTDRAGNTSELTNTYSVDTTVPSITASLGNSDVKNSQYYSADQPVTISITERNFDPADVSVRVNNQEQQVSWSSGAGIGTDTTVHTGTFTLSQDGSYSYTISYADKAGNTGESFYQPSIVIDKTSPVIENNFADFGNTKDTEIFYNASQKDNAQAVIKVKEANFFDGDMNISVLYKPAGSPHTDDGWTSEYYSANWKNEPNSDIHTLNIPFEKDGVYKITMSPVDRAGNKGTFGEKGKDEYPSYTAIFETDYTAPVIESRNGESVDADSLKSCVLYDYDKRNDDAPEIVFYDTNIDRIECDIRKYTPVYKNHREIGEIVPEESSETVDKLFDESLPTAMRFTLSDFELDGTYSVQLTAYDKAGNPSELNDNTFIRMVSTNVLAYIENSNSEHGEGWYSFEDENGPISKQPNSFDDLSIVILSKLSDDSKVLLVDKDTNTETDTDITSDPDGCIFDDTMYSVGAYRYTLEGDYFTEHYKEDADTSLYLRVKNGSQSLDLGEMYIDNTDPHCDIPEHFKDWGWFSGSGSHVLSFSNVSEILDENETVAYVDGETINLSDSDNGEFSYDASNNVISLELEPGSHTVGLLLVDRAGNTQQITEVRHLAIGNYRIWIAVGSVLGAAVLAFLAFFLIRRRRNRSYR